MNNEENERTLENQGAEDLEGQSQSNRQDMTEILIDEDTNIEDINNKEVLEHKEDTSQEVKDIHEEGTEVTEEVTQIYVTKDNIRRPFKEWIVGIAVASLCMGLGVGAGFSFVAPFNSAYYKKIRGGDVSGAEQAYVVESQAAVTTYTNEALPPESDGSIVDIAKRIGPSVVSVFNNKKLSAELSIFYSNTTDEVVTGIGSGIIFSEDDDYYYIMTNSHVVQGADSLAVNFLGDIKVEAKLVGKDSVNDIAVVKVQKARLLDKDMASIRMAPLGDSDHIEVGQLAIAIGTPATEALNNTVTTGIISAVERNITIAGNAMKVIQTDAAINPGNSGGALVGPTGEVIGMNVAKTVNTEGIGFSLPINKVKVVVADIMENGSVLRPALGITGIEVSNSNASLYDLPIGIYIESIMTGGSADLAGMKANDVLIQFEGETINTMTQLKALIAQKRVGDLVEVKVIREGVQKSFKLELKEMPES